jgi:hypothetical protein
MARGLAKVIVYEAGPNGAPNDAYAGGPRGRRQVLLVGQQRTVAIAVRNYKSEQPFSGPN